MRSPGRGLEGGGAVSLPIRQAYLTLPPPVAFDPGVFNC